MNLRAVFALVCSALSVGTVLAACNGENIATSASSPEPSLKMENEPDASDAGVSTPVVSVVDAGIAPATHGSPLCHVETSSDCNPDNIPGSQQCQRLFGDFDGGYGSLLPFDAAGPTLACHIALGGAVLAGEPTCWLPGSAGDGVSCYTPLDCAPGLECVGSVFPVCRKYCCSGNSRCGADQFCGIDYVVNSVTRVPVCLPQHPCTLLTDALNCPPDQTCCPGTETCAVVREDGSTSCVALGPAGAGDACDSVHCAEDLVCLGATGQRRCYALCTTTPSAHACPASQTCKGGLPLFTDPSVGVCE